MAYNKALSIFEIVRMFPEIASYNVDTVDTIFVRLL
jgi:hypothetical protein